MVAAVHLVRFCSSYISDVSTARRLLLVREGGAFFFVLGVIPPTPPSISLSPFFDAITIHTLVAIAITFNFSQNVLLSSCLSLAANWLLPFLLLSREKMFSFM